MTEEISAETAASSGGVRLQGLRKVYPDGTVALDGVDLHLERGLVGLLGPNGAGKTTLLEILTLGREPSAGSRRYFGLDDSAESWPRIRPRLGYLPQEHHPLGELSGAEYLQYCAHLRRVPLGRRALRRRVARLLDAVELGHAAHRRSGTYSGGMTRRLGLAQALVHAPSLLVVDEPTAGLDPEERIRFRNLVTDLADEIPVLLSTHIVEDIEATCPRLAVLGHGRKLFDGAPTELMRRCASTLWRLPEGRLPTGEADIDADLPRVGRRVDGDGTAWVVVHATDRPPGAEPLTPTLEEACSTFLALHGEESLEESLDDGHDEDPGEDGEPAA